MTKWRVMVAIVLLFAWAAQGAAGDLPRVIVGFSYAVDYLRGMWPPDLTILPSLVGPLRETLQMAIVATTLSAIVAVPLSFVAARNTAPSLLLYGGARSIINLLRAIPTLLWALLFVAMAGLGPLAGVFALTSHCVGTLGKYFSEAIEAISRETIEVMEAMRVDGANDLQVLYYGVLPAVLPLFIGYILYYFEYNVRVGTVLGLVGAGGLGLHLTMAIRLFRRQQTLAIILVIVGMVMLVDRFSRVARKRVLP